MSYSPWLRAGVLLLPLLAGCGTTRQNAATEQLLLSDAVDRAVAHVDFSPLAGEKIYLDTQFIRPVKDSGFANAEYIISSLRQQMVMAGCLLQERAKQADYIVEARVGAVGADGHDVSYGLPPSNTLNSAASLVPNAPTLPALPELSVAKRTEDLGAAKIGVFAYDRLTREPVWQAGISQAQSTAKNRWFLGIGPFQSGSIRERQLFAGEEIGGGKDPASEQEKKLEEKYRSAAVIQSKGERQRMRALAKRQASEAQSEIELAGYEEPVESQPNAQHGRSDSTTTSRMPDER